jgi:hypothetical protein
LESSQTENPNLGKILEDLILENVDMYIFGQLGIFYGDLGYFMTLWHILYSFGTFFSRFGIMYQEKSGRPDLDHFLEKET